MPRGVHWVSALCARSAYICGKIFTPLRPRLPHGAPVGWSTGGHPAREFRDIRLLAVTTATGWTRTRPRAGFAPIASWVSFSTIAKQVITYRRALGVLLLKYKGKHVQPIRTRARGGNQSRSHVGCGTSPECQAQLSRISFSSCEVTRSTPVASSVTVCSTWTRGLTWLGLGSEGAG